MSDNTKTMLLNLIVDELENEPPNDAGGHPSIEVHERAGADWAEWDKKVSGLRFVLAQMLVREAIDAHRAERAQP